MDKVRKCNVCGIVITETYQRRNICRVCYRLQQKIYRKRYTEKTKEYNLKWRTENKQKCLDASLKWRRENPDKVKTLNRDWRNKNNQKNKDRLIEYRKANPEKYKAYGNKATEIITDSYVRSRIRVKKGQIDPDFIDLKRQVVLANRKLKKLKL